MFSSLAESASLYGRHAARSNDAARFYAPPAIGLRTEMELQEELQRLLDAQGDGLLAGLDLSTAEDASSEGSRGHRVASRVRRDERPFSPTTGRDKGRKPSLQDARFGIFAAMSELAQVKGEESVTLHAQQDDAGAIVGQIHEWKEKKEGLALEMRQIEHSDEAASLHKLEAEELKVKAEIQELEARLSQLRATQRHLAADISRLTNSLDAKLSSYKASIALVDSEIRQFLSHGPATAARFEPVVSSSPQSASFMALPRDRRTLAMAEEHWKREHARVGARLARAELERDALEDGAQIWRDVVQEVAGFEAALRKQIRRLARQMRAGAAAAELPMETGAAQDGGLGKDSGGGVPIAESAQAETLARITADMDRTISLVESKLDVAEANDWKLLVCCIGAELEALREGKDVIVALLAPLSSSSLPSSKGTAALAENPDPVMPESHSPALGEGSRTPTYDSSGMVGRADVEGIRSHEPGHDLENEEDEDPDPDLLVSHEHF